jgi:hypothetical protein
MKKELIHTIIITGMVFLFAISALGYFVFPSGMLNIVGMRSDAQTDFLVRTLAAALVAFIPGMWAARHKSDAPIQRNILVGLATYLFLSSAVDFFAYLNGIVNATSIPSILLRVFLGGVILWLLPRR